MDEPWLKRYARLIPVVPEHLGSGPPDALDLVDSAELAEVLGVERLALVPLSRNVTGTFKDLEAAVVAAKANEWGVARASVHSTGNTARSYRHYFMEQGISLATFTPYSCASKLRGMSASSAFPMYAVDAPFNQVSAVAKRIAKHEERMHLAPLSWKIEGKAVVAYALAEKMPDVTTIVQTVAGGYGILGIHMGFTRLASTGLPRPVGVNYGMFQSADLDTLSIALIKGVQELTPNDIKVAESPFEATLQSTNPVATYSPLREVMEHTSGSWIESVPISLVEGLASVFSDACSRVGVPVDFEAEKSPFIAWAGLVRRARQGLLAPGARIAFLVTGGGIGHLQELPRFTAVVSSESVE